MGASLVAIGEVLKPYGLGGEVRVRVLTDQPKERFGTLRQCVLWEPAIDRREACQIARCRLDGDTVLVKMRGVDSPEHARLFSGRLLAVDQTDALPAPPGSFYPWQLEGARVETRDGTLLGTFVGIENGGAQDLWVVAVGGRERLIPAVAEIVVDVNVGERRVVIDPPEGLLEL